MALISYFPQIEGTKISVSTATRSQGGGSPNNIVDGNTGSTDSQTSGAYWEIDLGSVKNICKVRLHPTSGYYSVRVSDTGAFAGEEYYVLTADNKGSDFAGFPINFAQWNDYYINPLVSARYIRIYAEANATLNEVEIYETTESVFGVLTSDDSNYNGTIDTVEEAHRRRWISKDTANPTADFAFTKYAQLDLGSIKTVDRIDTYIGQYSDYKIQISTTGAFSGEEITIHNGARATGQYQDTTNLPSDTRYIRIYGNSNTFLRELDILHKPSTEELFDIDNDFRSIATTMTDIDNDFRMIGSESIGDINNDFRTLGAILSDILNDFRMIGEQELKDITNDYRMVAEVLSDIENKFNTVIAPDLEDILNKFNIHNRTISDIENQINIVASQLKDIVNDFRTIKLVQNDVQNDFRMICQWQICPLS